MLSTEARRRRQSGQSLVEALVASALLGITVVAALGALEVAGGAATQAARTAWARCLSRSAAEAVEASAWQTSYTGVAGVSIGPVQGPAGGSPADLQTVPVSVYDPGSGRLLSRLTVLKLYALRGGSPFSALAPGVGQGCPSP